MLINIIWFYISWWSIALLASKNMNLEILIVGLISTIIHFYLFRTELKKELKTVAIISAFGMIVDYLLHLTSVITFLQNFPLWLPLIWIIFSATFRHSLKKFLSLPDPYVFSISAVSGPFSYYLASKLNLILYPTSIQKIIVHFFVWGILMLLMKKILWRINESN